MLAEIQRSSVENGFFHPYDTIKLQLILGEGYQV
nr:MAG TPA: hypothetical protein [Caudoviricetes sp.]